MVGKRITDSKIVDYYVKKKQSCRNRKIPFNLSLTSIRNLLKADRCYYTGLTLMEDTFSIDRVDSSMGYVKGNVVACHRGFNTFKGQMENPNNNLSYRNIFQGFKKLEKRLEKCEK